ncbi:MAG: TRAP transporter substrate-binding protein DctP [Sutterellaceae bacterium]|nr:TRAP transporter substrate-binding protein DctP [Sutterellaceae bacterium]MDD7442455.1 TRAP transporter substrate-binding protein DctP [Sutterellaceae bacterium]MDY2867382.1 TRAP transporter substrate-binding protein DctP [Mesosutterella sp.]
MLTKRTFLTAVAAGAVTAMVPSVATAAKSWTLTFSTHAVENSFRGRAEKAYLDEVTRLTKGAVKFRIFWGQSLIKGNEVLKGIQNRVVDCGVVNINYYPKELLANNAINTINERGKNYRMLLDFYDQVYKTIPVMKDELLKYKNTPLLSYAVMTYAATATKPVKKLSDLKGMKVRSASRWHLPILRELGAQPVSVPWGDCVMALQTKVVDAVLSNIDSIRMTKMDETAPNIFVMDKFVNAVPFIITINSQRLASMPADIQKAFADAAVAALPKIASLEEKEFGEVIAQEKKAGCKVTFMSAADLKQWESLKSLSENKKQWVKEATQAGLPNAQATLDKVYALFYKLRGK